MSELYHHGILGMKWGVRRTPEQLGHRTGNKELKNRIVRSSGSRNSETLKKARKSDINKLSNQELREFNDRLNLENNFANLTKGNIGKAKNWVATTIVGGIVVGAVSEVSKTVVKSWLKERFKI